MNNRNVLHFVKYLRVRHYYRSLSLLFSTYYYLFVKMTNPLSKLFGIGNGGRQEDVMHVIWQKDDCFFPNDASFYNEKEVYV